MAQRTFDVDLTVPAGARKQASAFYPPAVAARVRRNAAASAWGRALRRRIIAAAAPYVRLGAGRLWDLVFAPGSTRAWTVWDRGWCPACRAPVPLYAWRIDAPRQPWKVACPHCAALFPTNDFAAYYRSGLGPAGLFDPVRAERRLLVNTAHPDPADPLHHFGVDDGEGYADAAGHRWRFIGAYLVYGQWKQLILPAIHRLAVAHLVTGRPHYARLATVLLDRVADVYPDFDYLTQGAEKTGGYVSMWHDASGETRILALAYDMVFAAARRDPHLVVFLARRARRCGLRNPKACFADIQRNIEERILRDACAHRPKIMCNYPQSDFTLAVLLAVHHWPANRAALAALLDWIVLNSTGTDGVSGEKGMTDYSSFTVAGLAQCLALFDGLDPSLLPGLLRRHPALRHTFRFHPDLRCLGRYFPQVGDGGAVARPADPLLGLYIFRDQGLVDTALRADGNPWVISTIGLTPSMLTFLWRLWRLTGDPLHVQRLAEAAGDPADPALPWDLACAAAPTLRRNVRRVLARHGREYRPGSVLKAAWHLAVLRSGNGPHEHALWLHYDTAGMWHGHSDGLNLGLFARGLDLLPDLGYPPLQFPEARADWYKHVGAHNTVAVDGRQRARFGPPVGGRATLWADGRGFRAVQVSAPDMLAAMDVVAGTRYERTVALVDLDPASAYVLDVFRVTGGHEHTKFTHTCFGHATPRGLRLAPAEPYGHGAQLRRERTDPAAAPGWSADIAVEDRLGLLPPDRRVRLRYTDLTHRATAVIAQGWAATGARFETTEAWLPWLLVRRRATGRTPLASTFVAVLEPYEGSPGIAAVRRLPVRDAASGRQRGDGDVALTLALAGGSVDAFALIDQTCPAPAGVRVPALGLRLAGEGVWLRRAVDGTPVRIVLLQARSLSAGALEVTLRRVVPFLELTLGPEGAAVTAGPVGAIAAVCWRGRRLPVRATEETSRV